MGYDTRLYIVEEHTNFCVTGEKYWAEIIGMVELCNCPMSTKLFTEPAGGFIFAHDGNSVISKDRYGSELHASTIDEVIDELTEIAEREHYRRAIIARDFLASIRENYKTSLPDRLMVYKYGH